MEVLAFTYGDSEKTSTWSNVPYFFLNSLAHAENDVVLHRVNISPEDRNFIYKIIAKFANLISRKILKQDEKYFRSEFHNNLIRKYMLNGYKKYPESDVLLSFDFSNSIADAAGSKAKTLMFCDWTIEYKIRCLDKREPTDLECNYIKMQEETLKHADWIITIFPNSYDFLKKKYPDKVYYLGNVINGFVAQWDLNQITKTRMEKNNILFIGKEKYKDSLLSLLRAVEKYNASGDKKYFIHLIGMKKNEVPKSKYLTCYGYLNKDDESERNTYYALIKDAKFLVNTNDNWVGASSVIETMYYGLPVIINPNDDLIKTFSENIDFGIYCDNHEENILNAIKKMDSLSYDAYLAMCQNAQEAVKDFTWDAYIKKVLNLIK